jgi:putative flippase GtrA
VLTDYSAELVRYVINGLVATAAHYTTLKFNLDVLGFASAGIANIIAAVIGISTSFLGSRYFVFRKTNEPLTTQAMKFSGLYCTIAVLHGLVLLIWTDLLDFDYRVGFLIATAFQVSISYVGNKLLVFKV